MTTVTLREWETRGPEAHSLLAHRSLAAYPAGQRLAEELTRTGRIEVLELARGLELRATSFVGRFSLGEVTVTVQPKITGLPLLSLFRYAYDLRHLDRYGVVDFASSQWTFQDLLIQQLVAEGSELLARGIHRDYECTRTELASPRGRIDFGRYVGATQRAQASLPCVHHPRIEDTLLNRVLLAGIILAAGLATDADLRAHARRLAKMLATTVSAQRLDRLALAEASRAMDRRTNAYKPALTLVGLLLGGQGLALDEQGSRVRLSGFLFDMNRFFQALISRFLHEHLSASEVHDEYRLKDMFSYVGDQNPRARRAPTQRPDFVVMHSGQMLAVLDAKYRDLWDKPLPREMLYQLALYALGRQGAERTSAILYPTVNAAAREQVIDIHEPVRGVPQARVALRPVNLLELEKMLRAGRAGQSSREDLAQWLAFGESVGRAASALSGRFGNLLGTSTRTRGDVVAEVRVFG